MAYTYFENEQDFYATDMDDRITNSDVANMIADEARTSQLIAVDADEARTSQLIGDLCNTYYDTAFRAHNISNISAGIKQLLIGKIRFSSDGDWYTCLWDDGANVHLVDSRVAEKENLEKMGTETHIVKGVGGNQQVTPLASPINVDFETTVKSQPYSDMLIDCKTSDLKGSFDVILSREIRMRKQLHNTMDFHVDYPSNTVIIDQEIHIPCSVPIGTSLYNSVANYATFRKENAHLYYTATEPSANSTMPAPLKYSDVHVAKINDTPEDRIIREQMSFYAKAYTATTASSVLDQCNNVTALAENLNIEQLEEDEVEVQEDDCSDQQLVHVFNVKNDIQYRNSGDKTTDKLKWFCFSSGTENYACTVETVESTTRQTFVRPKSFEHNVQQILANKECDLPEHLRDNFKNLLKKFTSLTTLPTGEDTLGPLNTKEQLIVREEEGAAPVSKRAYNFGPKEMKELQIQLQFLLAKGYIRPSKSPYGAPVLFAPKADGGLRLCIDYRDLNKQTVNDCYGLPKISDIFDQCAGDAAKRAKYFSCIDLVWAYWQIRVHESSTEKLAITTPMGSYDFLVCPFGIKQAPSTFQRVVENVLRPYLTKFCMAYIDDIVVYSNTAEEHMQHLDLIFQALQKANFRIKLEKCSFFCKNVKLLGWVIGRDGRKIDPTKVESITNYKRPETYPQLARFLGAITHVRDVIPKCAQLIEPLTSATKNKDIRKITEKNGQAESIEWTEEMCKSFADIKQALVSPPTLKLVDPHKPFYLECDASDTTIHGTLFQKHAEKLYPVAYHSRKLSETEFRWHIIEKEALSMVEALKKWDKYLLDDATVTVLGDSKPVEAIIKMKNPKPKHLRWLLQIQAYNYEYIHVPGTENLFADAFTRAEMANYTFAEQDSFDSFVDHVFLLRNAINMATENAYHEIENLSLRTRADSLPIPISADAERFTAVTPLLSLQKWLENIKSSYANDNIARSVMDKITTTENGSLKLINDIIFHVPANQNKPKTIYVPADIALRKAIVETYHDTSFSQHFDVTRTLEKIKRSFYWPKMKLDVEEHIKSCVKCLRGKYRTVSRPAMDMPMDVPHVPWIMVGVDAKTGLPRTKYGNDMFWMIVDYFCGMMHIVPGRKEGQTSKKLAMTFLREVFRHHGLPLKIVSDRDPLFTAEFWTTFWKELTTILNMSTARNPWTDGKSERYIRAAVEIFRVFCMDHPTHWDVYAPAVEFAFNDTVNPRTNFTPFKANTLGEPHTPVSLLISQFREASNLPDDPFNYIKDISHINQYIREKLMAINQARRYELAQRGHIPFDFHKGDKVMIENPVAVNNWKRLKALEPRYTGPFTLGDQIGPNRWLVQEWKDHSLRHPVVNASKFKPVRETQGPPTFNPLNRDTEPTEREPAATPPRPLRLAQQPVTAPTPTPATANTETQFPKILGLSVCSIKEQAGSSDSDTPFDRFSYTISVKVQKDDSDTEQQCLDVDKIVSDQQLREILLEYLRDNDQTIVEIRQQARQQALTQYNQIPQLDADWFNQHKRNLHKYLQRNKCCPLLEYVAQQGSKGLVVQWDPIFYSCPIRILFDDMDSGDYSRSEFGKLRSVVYTTHSDINIITDISQLNAEVANLETPENCLRLLQALIPGKWTLNHAAKLVNRQLGGPTFNLDYIPTEPDEVKTLVPFLNTKYMDTLRGIDPCCGTRAIQDTLAKFGVSTVEGNDVNPLFKDVTSYDALNPAVYQTKWKDVYDFAITSPPFSQLDVIIPMLAVSFPIVVLHVPPWYIFDANNARHTFLARLAEQQRCTVLSVTYTRNKTLGRYCIWVAIAKSKAILDKFISIKHHKPVIQCAL